LTEIKNDIYFALEETKKYKTEKEELVSRLRRIDKEVEQLEDENIELNKNIVKFSKIEDIEMWIQQRKENKELLESNIEKIGSCKERKNNILKRRNDLEEEMKKVLEQVEKSNEIKRYLDFCSNAYGIFNETEQEIVDEVRIQIETLTFDLFKKLDWRAEEYGHLELNSNYKLKLFYKDTQYSCLGSCSAAERLLMALAFTIAIHQVSGHNCLLFIDSPVGRVSDINRTNFAKSLIRTSEFKQIILAFTPSEYSEEISDLFNSTVVASRRELVAESMHYEED
jgi:DNA sulfur modification protein DndD